MIRSRQPIVASIRWKNVTLNYWPSDQMIRSRQPIMASIPWKNVTFNYWPSDIMISSRQPIVAPITWKKCYTSLSAIGCYPHMSRELVIPLCGILFEYGPHIWHCNGLNVFSTWIKARIRLVLSHLWNYLKGEMVNGKRFFFCKSSRKLVFVPSWRIPN